VPDVARLKRRERTNRKGPLGGQGDQVFEKEKKKRELDAWNGFEQPCTPKAGWEEFCRKKLTRNRDNNEGGETLERETHS